MAISFIVFVHDNAGAAVEGATMNLYDRNTTTPVRATTTTDSTGKGSISHATEGRFDVEIVNGSSKERLKYDDSIQMEAAEFALLNMRGADEAFKYVITPGTISAERILNIPVLTKTAAFFVTPAIEDLDLDGFNIDNGGVIFLKEQAEADADVAGSGQIWVNTATPNELWFTDDAGTDTQLNVAAVTQATKGALEAETNENTYAPPDLIKNSPGIAKVHGKIDSGQALMTGSYNIATVTDNGTGDYTVNFDVDFSAATFTSVGIAVNAGRAAEDRVVQVGGSPAVGSQRYITTVNASLSNIQSEIACYGAQ